MAALERLALQLQEQLGLHRVRSGLAGDAGLARMMAVARVFAPPRGRFQRENVVKGILAFQLRGEKTPYPALKYACYGLGIPMNWSGQRLVEDEKAVRLLLATVDRLRHRPVCFRMCCRALAMARAADSSSAAEGWRQVEEYLADRRWKKIP